MSGRDFYNSLYKSKLYTEAEWLRRGARAKVDSIEILLSRRGIKPFSLVELGAGTGAVIDECQSRRLASQYTAVDYSMTAVNYLQQYFNNTVKIVQGDITAPDFQLDGYHDLLVISHVIEHLEDPLAFLRAVKARISFRYVIVEVPLEDLFLSRLKSRIKDRRQNGAGHVQFFAKASIEQLITDGGFDILDSRIYAPVASFDTLKFIMRMNQLPAWRFFQMVATQTIMPLIFKSFSSRFYYSHYAALCRVATPTCQ